MCPPNTRVPFYLMPPNTPLPASREHVFGTVIPNQRKVRLSIVESGISPDAPHVEIGECVIDGLPPDLPVDSEIVVTISYDASARIQVSAVDKASGKAVTTELVRTESVRTSTIETTEDDVAPADLEPTLKDRPAALSPIATSAPLRRTTNRSFSCRQRGERPGNGLRMAGATWSFRGSQPKRTS